jgi:nucleoside-triphosphatase
VRNFLITGPPRCGKTTLVSEVSGDSLYRRQIGGFITEEIRLEGERVGFKIVSMPEQIEALLARKNFPSRYHVGKYGVNIKDLETVGCASIKKALHSGKVVLVDEVGKMEIFSKKFRNIFIQALDSPNKVLATIMERQNEFADSIKRRNDIKLVQLNRKNFAKVFHEVQNWLKNQR